MKRLLLMRHAEATLDGRPDIERPLNERGASAAGRMGGFISGRDLCPEQIISSSAARALETATILKACSHLNVDIRQDERIYEAGPQTLLDVTADIDDDFDLVMLVGHNPGFEGFIALLTDTTRSMHAGAIAVIDLQIETWRAVNEGIGTLIEVIHP